MSNLFIIVVFVAIINISFMYTETGFDGELEGSLGSGLQQETKSHKGPVTFFHVSRTLLNIPAVPRNGIFKNVLWSYPCVIFF